MQQNLKQFFSVSSGCFLNCICLGNLGFSNKRDSNIMALGYNLVIVSLILVVTPKGNMYWYMQSCEVSLFPKRPGQGPKKLTLDRRAGSPRYEPLPFFNIKGNTCWFSVFEMIKLDICNMNLGKVLINTPIMLVLTFTEYLSWERSHTERNLIPVRQTEILNMDYY